MAADGNSSDVAPRVADFTAFATLGAVSTTQDLVRLILSEIEGAEQDLVAEESLCLVAVATARTATVALREQQAVRDSVVPVLHHLPFTYRDYLVGSGMMNTDADDLDDVGKQVTQRLGRKQEFYNVHLPEGQLPGERLLSDKMELWMGRVSPPKLPTTPSERLHSMDLVNILWTHLRLVLSYGRQFANAENESGG